MINSELTAPVPLSEEHKIVDFDCGESSLNDWLKRKGLRNQASNASRCFVICHEQSVIGFYTLAAGAISHECSPKKMRRNMPDPLPVLVLGRLAIDVKYQNQGLGSALLRDAMLRAVSVSVEAGVCAVLLHALSQEARKFYLSRGFIESPLQSMTLMMTIGTIRKVLAEK